MSSQEQKITSLLDRLRQENRSSTNTTQFSEYFEQKPPKMEPQQPPPLPLSRPSLQLGLNSSTRRRPQDLTFTTKSNENLETDRKLKEIMKTSGNLTINNVLYKTDIKDLEHLEELGNGTCGHVVKMRHKPSNKIIAVKQMRRSGNSEENKRIIMDIEVVLKSHDCRFIVQCLGCFITDSEVWICMELMTTCFDKLLKRLGKPIPEEILGKVTVATVEALSYLKDKHGVIHRDVKPSNILLDTKGFVKLCDFGISGRLVDSMAKTRSAGCAAYLAPERIEPDPKNPDYDIRADVWSLGITLVELATGVFPYPDCNTDFEVLTKVIGQDPPSLPDTFSIEFRNFVKCCLTKDQKQRPKYAKLKSMPFIKKYENKIVNVGEWVVNAIQQADNNSVTTPRLSAQLTFRRFFSTSPTRPSPTITATTSTSTNHHPHPQPPLLQQYPPPPTPAYRPLPLKPPSQNDPLLPTPPTSSTHHQHHMSRYHTYRTLGPQSSAVPTPPPESATLSSVQVQQQNGGKVIGYIPLPAVPPPSSQSSKEYGRVSRHLFTEPQTSAQRRACSETRWRSSPSGSPLPLRNNSVNTNNNHGEPQQQYGNTSPIVLQRFYHQQKQQQKEYEDTNKKRFASYIKLQLGGERTNTSGRSSRHQSPEPPPRLNRTISGAGGGGGEPSLHRTLLDAATCSPSLSRRYVSPSPPVPSPQRLSESVSVPGSPQHFRTRFHYTPEPQRHLFSQNNDVS